MKKTLHLTVFLAIVGALSAGVLSYVNGLTAPIIEAQKLAAVQESLEILYPGATFSELNSEEETGLVTGAYLAEGEGYIYKLSVTGYNASTPIEFMISFDNAGDVSGFVVLSQQETNGIGSRVATDEFTNMVVGTNVNDSISTLSGATVSSTAVIKGINAAKALYGEHAGVSVEAPKDPVVEEVVYTLSDDYSSNAATVVAVDGNTYTVTANGFPGNAANEYLIVVENGAIVSVTNTVYGDTPGVGDPAVKEDVLAGYAGSTLESEVDVVSGSTFTSKSVFAAMQAALKSAAGETVGTTDEDTTTEDSGETEETVEGDSYTATATGFHGDVTVTVVVNGSDIVDVQVTHDETPGIGTMAVDELPAKIIETDSADVDTVSGATFTSNAIIEAVKAALAEAGLGAVEGDSYTASAAGFGGDVTVTIVLNGDDIVSVTAEGPNETQGIGSNAIDVLPGRIMDSDSADVDVVSGATVTSEAIIDATLAALAQAGK